MIAEKTTGDFVIILTLMVGVFVLFILGMRKPKKIDTGNGPHNFEPRYDQKPVADLKTGSFEGPPDVVFECVKAQFDALIKKTYVCDVCTYCGKVIKRKEETKC